VKKSKFNTITGSCWKKSLREARERRKKNMDNINEQIREAIKQGNFEVNSQGDVLTVDIIVQVPKPAEYIEVNFTV